MFSSTFSTTKPSLEIPRQRHFLNCKVDEECFVESIEGLIETYERQPLNKNSDISCADAVANACKIIIRELHALPAKKRVGSKRNLLGFISADISISRHARSFEYVRGPVFNRGKASDSIKLLDAYILGHVLSAEGKGAAWCGVLFHRGSNEEPRDFISGCGAT